MTSLLPAIPSGSAISPRALPVRPLLATEGGARAHARFWAETDPSEAPAVEAASPEQDSADDTGPGWQARPETRTATDDIAEEKQPAAIAFSPEFLAQILAQLDPEARTAEEFDEAARAYRRYQRRPTIEQVVDTSEHIDFDA